MHDHVSSSRRPRPDDVIEKPVEDVETTVRGDAGLPHAPARALYTLVALGSEDGCNHRVPQQADGSGGRNLVKLDRGSQSTDFCFVRFSERQYIDRRSKNSKDA